jgi:TATA-box binding protein (TBP) (component of TFIID and TFIIIB)
MGLIFMSYALQNIRKYKQYKRSQYIKTILYAIAETATAILIFAFGLLVIGMGN